MENIAGGRCAKMEKKERKQIDVRRRKTDVTKETDKPWKRRRRRGRFFIANYLL